MPAKNFNLQPEDGDLATSFQAERLSGLIIKATSLLGAPADESSNIYGSVIDDPPPAVGEHLHQPNFRHPAWNSLTLEERHEDPNRPPESTRVLFSRHEAVNDFWRESTVAYSVNNCGDGNMLRIRRSVKGGPPPTLDQAERGRIILDDLSTYEALIDPKQAKETPPPSPYMVRRKEANQVIDFLSGLTKEFGL